MRPDLSTSSSANIFLNQIPVLAIQPKGFYKLIMFFISPPSIIDICRVSRSSVAIIFALFSGDTGLSLSIAFFLHVLINEFKVYHLMILIDVVI
jgi:hypothetical protein